MISEHLLTKDEVAAVLKKAGYEPAPETIDGCSCWRAPCGLHLLVPELPPDGMSCERTLYEAIALMDAHAKSKAH